jgi:hypothetical protein
MSGMLYLIHEREFIKTNEDIYKFGRTENLSQRITQYPKGSKLLFAIKIMDEKTAESELIKKLSIEFKARPDIGREYFQGDYKMIMKIIFEYVILNNNNIYNIEDNKQDEINIKKEKKDETIMMMEYVDENREILNNKLIKSKDFYEDVLKWIEKKDYNVYISHAKMTKIIIKCFGVISKVHRFEKSIDQGLQFPELVKEEVEMFVNKYNFVENFMNYFINIEHEKKIYYNNELYNIFIEYQNKNKFNNEITVIKFGMEMNLLIKKNKIKIEKLRHYGKNRLTVYIFN